MENSDFYDESQPGISSDEMVILLSESVISDDTDNITDRWSTTEEEEEEDEDDDDELSIYSPRAVPLLTSHQTLEAVLEGAELPLQEDLPMSSSSPAICSGSCIEPSLLMSTTTSQSTPVVMLLPQPEKHIASLLASYTSTLLLTFDHLL